MTRLLLENRVVTARSNNRTGINKFYRAPSKLNRLNNSRATRTVTSTSSDKVNAASHNINTHFDISRETSVLVTGLSKEATKRSIYELFNENVGGIRNVKIGGRNGKKWAKVLFRNVEEAQLAVLKFNNVIIGDTIGGNRRFFKLRVSLMAAPSPGILRALSTRIKLMKSLMPVHNIS
ncbi:hypothetical protein TPHA_0J02700 [Tetrapisispora phaffii CBS 4417]|uniref:RRM domain-containing protein n=1 Tax=Tetrapisispora phaffii (strain ATCC 24235 / CBS 4417 / NBRC 1672 / NRRL Y-8282 / UCD 70-5) TaxID=1071381 RepID=G8BYZ8_TETPH|nr:hypothetical protein TPHA_0J02700 [Tetrapisispora phaffii CBS 4417]CCE65090.1 hypothetical protein TPHA_0J02700 [Tetrapisispora phaffii CBS 4417]